VLKRFRLNGYGREEKAWKFFRAKMATKTAKDAFQLMNESK
jgi:hypothetical protein